MEWWSSASMDELIRILDRIWQSELASEEAATAILPALSDSAILTMSSCLLEAAGSIRIIERDPNFLLLEYQGIATRCTVSREPSDNTLITFSDIPASLVATEERFKRAWGPSRPYRAAAVLSAMQYARDHVDSLLLLPPEMRNRRTSQASTAFGIPPEMLRALSVLMRRHQYQSERQLTALTAHSDHDSE